MHAAMQHLSATSASSLQNPLERQCNVSGCGTARSTMCVWRVLLAVLRRCLVCSAVSMTLVMPVTCCSTLGDRAFPVSAARTWNVLPSGVRAASSLTTFRQKLKQTLFLQSFPDEWLATVCLYSAPVTVYKIITDSVTLISSLVIIINNNNKDDWSLRIKGQPTNPGLPGKWLVITVCVCVCVVVYCSERSCC